MTIQTDLAKRFIKDISARVSKAREKGSDSIRIDLADIDILVGMAEGSDDRAVYETVVAICRDVAPRIIAESCDRSFSGVDYSTGPHDLTTAVQVRVIGGEVRFDQDPEPTGEGEAIGCG